MSTKAKATLAGTVLGTIGIVYFVHYQQVADKAVSQYLAIYSLETLVLTLDVDNAPGCNP